MLRAPQNDVALVGGDKHELLLSIQSSKDRVFLALSDSRLDRHADAAVGPEVEDHGGVAPEPVSPVEENDVHSLDIQEMIGAGFKLRIEIVDRTVFKVANVFDRHRIPGDH